MFTGFGITLTEEEAIKSPFWYLQYQGSEHGPFKFDELTKLIGSKKLLGTIHFWRPGLTHWISISVQSQDLSPASILIQGAIALYEKMRRRRQMATASAALSPKKIRRDERQGFVGSVFAVSPSGRRRYLGVCFDLSRRGIGVTLDNESDCPVGSELVLEIVPISCSGLSSFQIRGEVRWNDDSVMGVELSDGLGADQALEELNRRRDTELVAAETAAYSRNPRQF